MSRHTLWSVCLFGLGAIATSLASWNPIAAQPKSPPTTKSQSKKGEPEKKPQPAKPEPTKPGSGTAQPPASPVLDGTPFDLVRGLREQGMADLALEYLRDLEKKALTPALKAELPLEKAKCQLEAADEEADEGTRLSLIGEAKDLLNAFLKASPNHPRSAEARLALARLFSLDAKTQLAKARRIDVPAEEGAAQTAAVQKQRGEALEARTLFTKAAKEFQEAAKSIQAQLSQGKLEPNTRRALFQSKFDAELASGVNQFSLGETYLHPTAKEKKERSDLVDKARETFSALAKEEQTPPRVAWVARAWMAECEYEKENHKVGEEANAKILAASPAQDAEDGKRMVRMFQLRRKLVQALNDKSAAEMQAVTRDARSWLNLYGRSGRGQAEKIAVQWYLAFSLQAQADSLPLLKSSGSTPSISTTARQHYVDAEKLYRQISQSDNEYAHRAGKQRMIVVRRLLGEADKPPTEYKSFEECQMASLIQMSKLADVEKDPSKGEEARKRRQAVVALLERARLLATEKDSRADVSDVLIRLIYYYQQTGEPFKAAVLGEHVARTVKSAGGKSAVAGVLGLNGYIASRGQIRATEADKLEVAQKADRERAIRLARFLDEKYPNDTATDRARYQLAVMLYEEGKLVDAYDALLKVRPGYEQIGSVRLFEGALGTMLTAHKDSPLPVERRRDVFRRVTSDIDKLQRPSASADEQDVRTYLSARSRLALLYLSQSRIDEAAEKAAPGYARARQIAEQVIEAIPSYGVLVNKTDKSLNSDGWEMKLLAEDVRTRAVYLEGQAFFVQGKYEEVFKAIGKVLAEMNESGPYIEIVKKSSSAAPAKMAPPEKKDAAPKKDGPEKKDTPAKKEPAPKKSDDETAAGDGTAAASDRALKLAEGVDKLRRDLIVLALKARVRQAQAEKGAELLDLLKKFGGSVEANVATLQQLTTEMAAQILGLRKAGKLEEANALSAGFAKLLDKVSAEPNLPPSVQLFLGQALILVGEYPKAEEMLKKVPPPANPDLLKPNAQVPDSERQKVGEYRRATLELARCYRESKKFNEGQAVIQAAMGTKEKQGWAFSSLDFRKEHAYLNEARGAAEADPKKAKEYWGNAVQEWTLLVTVARKRLETEPKDATTGRPDNAAILRNKNAFYDAFFDYNRCIAKANMSLMKGSPKLAERLADAGKKCAGIERTSGGDITPEVRARYAEFLNEVPEVRKGYEEAGGKLFLEKPAVPGGM